MNTKQIMISILKNTVLSCDHGANWSGMIRAQMMVITEGLVQHMELALRNSITKVKSASRITLDLVENLSWKHIPPIYNKTLELKIIFFFLVLQVDDQMKLLQDSWSEMLILDHIHHRWDITRAGRSRVSLRTISGCTTTFLTRLSYPTVRSSSC